MKVLQMNCWLELGSTGKIVHALQDYMERCGDDSYAIYGMGEKSSNPKELRTTPKMVRKMQSFRSRITGYPYGGCIWGTTEAIRFLKKVQPEVVHIHCINGYMVNVYKVLSYLKGHHIPTVVTNHAEFMYTGGCTHAIECEKWKIGCHSCDKLNAEHPISYFFDKTANEWKKMHDAYYGFEKLHICNVSDWLTERAKQSPFFVGYPMSTVFNGLSTNDFHYRETANKANRIRPLIVHVTPNFYDNIKGGKHVLEMCKRFPNVDFLVVGSKENGTIERLPNLHFRGSILNQKELARVYSSADVCLLTSLRETFSMVTAESLCCGTPVVGFRAGGPESIALKDYSIFVEQGDDDALEHALKEMLSRKVQKQVISNEACSKYSEETMCKHYYQIYKDLLYSKDESGT